MSRDKTSGLPDLDKLKARCASAKGIALHSPSVSPNTTMQLIDEIERLRALLAEADAVAAGPISFRIAEDVINYQAFYEAEARSQRRHEDRREARRFANAR